MAVVVAPGASRLRAVAPELALLLLALPLGFSWGPGSLPSTPAALCTLAAAQQLLQAGLANVAIALVQIFAPEWADGQGIAAHHQTGVGHLLREGGIAVAHPGACQHEARLWSGVQRAKQQVGLVCPPLGAQAHTVGCARGKALGIAAVGLVSRMAHVKAKGAVLLQAGVRVEQQAVWQA